MSSTPRAAANLQAQEERTTARLDYSATRTSCLTNWGPTFDMSGGPKGAKRPLGRPLDGGVRRQRENSYGFGHVPSVQQRPPPQRKGPTETAQNPHESWLGQLSLGAILTAFVEHFASTDCMTARMRGTTCCTSLQDIGLPI
jgi:hypothetical protein